MQLIAHRGFAATHPENTLAAVIAAAEVADVVEVDVRRCASGELVVVHDATVDRVTDGSGRVADLTLSELSELSVLSSDESIPTLEAVLAAVPPEVGVNVELKEAGLADDAVAALAEADNASLVSSFDPAVLEEVGDAAPTAYLSADEEGSIERAVDLGCVAVHPNHQRCIGTDFVDRAHEAGLAVHAWTVAAAVTAKALARAGVDGIIADRPLLDALDEA